MRGTAAPPSAQAARPRPLPSEDDPRGVFAIIWNAISRLHKFVAEYRRGPSTGSGLARDKVCDKALPQAGAVDPRLTARQAQGEIKTKFATKFGWVCVRIVTWFRKRDSCEHPQGEHSRFPDFKFNPSFEASGRTRRVVLYQEIKKSGRDGGLVE